MLCFINTFTYLYLKDSNDCVVENCACLDRLFYAPPYLTT